MRLWSLHPSYLDAKGLVALWREGLLAQAVLSGQTHGYKNHPQLERFKSQPHPRSGRGNMANVDYFGVRVHSLPEPLNNVFPGMNR